MYSDTFLEGLKLRRRSPPHSVVLGGFPGRETARWRFRRREILKTPSPGTRHRLYCPVRRRSTIVSRSLPKRSGSVPNSFARIFSVRICFFSIRFLLLGSRLGRLSLVVRPFGC